MKSYAIKLVVLVAAVLMLGACTQPKSSIGVVNTAKIYQESEAGKAGVKHLEALHEEMQNEINKMQAELQKNPSDDVKRQFQQLYTDYHPRRLAVKPGLTGPMQVSGRGDLPFSDRLQLELEYIDNYSLRRDLSILLRTVPVLLQGKGAH